jgi:RimJ/RimL family protein N-acetyltransferase
MPGPAFARGDRVSLHPVEAEDHEFVQYGRNHPEVRVPLTDSTIRTSGDVAEMFEDSEYHFLVCVEDPDEQTGYGPEDGPEPVGVVAFPWVRESTKVGSLMYWAAPEHHGNGYVTEATALFLDYVFDECGFHKVNARVNEDNEASAAVLEKLGFEREGTKRAESIVDGEWTDMHMYGLLADEWGGR